MSFIDNLAENRRLAEYLYEEGVELVSKLQDVTPRAEIVDWLRACIANSEICLRSSQGSRTDIANAIKHGLLFPTSYGSVMTTSKEVQEQFERYVDGNRILDANKLAARKGLTTLHSVKKACKAGDIARIEDLGNSVALFVD